MCSANNYKTKETSPNLIGHFWQSTSKINGFPTASGQTVVNYALDENALRIMMKMGDEHTNSDKTEHDENLTGTSRAFDIPNYEECDTTITSLDLEMLNVHEEIKWIAAVNYRWFPGTLDSWMIKGPMKLTVEDETNFCNPSLLKKIFSAKGVFDIFDQADLCRARSRANPFETIRSAFFMNRAALKMANIDAVSNFIFTDIDRNPRHSKRKGPYYFADVCAGPGGFSEYILWRKKWMFKGFGFTLRREHDFELEKSYCASPVTFGAQYGSDGTGDVCCPENVKHFARRVVHESEGCGVHFMMSDGGFSVEGNENLQEILSKQLYVCQCLMAMEIVRPHGHFVTKLFDLFTPFSVGLVFLMYSCFEKIAILKPHTSRPANAERYLICFGLKPCPQTTQIRAYLSRIAGELWQLRQVRKDLSVDVREIVPMSVVRADQEFYRYITERNNSIGEKQVLGLSKLAAFCRNPHLIESRQEKLRAECLQYWRIPNRPKIPPPRFAADDLLATAVRNPDFVFAPRKQVRDVEDLARSLDDVHHWHCAVSGCERKTNVCNFYAGVSGSRVYRLQRRRWTRVKRLQLVSGTLLYGELVTENIRTDNGELGRQSLHVIDALRLGDISLVDLPFEERLSLIETYCEAVDHESQDDSVRVRANPVYRLKTVASLSRFLVPGPNHELRCHLPPLGFNSLQEYYRVNSILFLKTVPDAAFKSMFVTRIQLFMEAENCEGDLNSCPNNCQKIIESLVNYVSKNIVTD